MWFFALKVKAFSYILISSISNFLLASYLCLVGWYYIIVLLNHLLAIENCFETQFE